MRHSLILASIVIFTMLTGVCRAQDAPDSAGQAPGALDAILQQMPADSTTATEQLSMQIMAMGPDAVRQVCDRLQPPEAGGKDAKERYALGTLTFYVMRPGAEDERKGYVEALLHSLDSESDPDIRKFLITQLQYSGGEESVAPLAKLLTDEQVGQLAMRSLVAIGSPAARQEIAQAIRQSEVPNQVALIQAAGDLRAEQTVAALVDAAESQDREVRLAARTALAQIAALEAEQVLAQALETTSTYERGQALKDYILYTHRLAESKKRAKALELTHKLADSEHGDEDFVQCAVLSNLVALNGREAVPELLKAADSPSREVRAAALKLGAAMEGSGVTRQWVEKLRTASGEAKAQIVTMLGDRRDPASLSQLKRSLEDEDPVVRIAAIPAVFVVGGKETVPDLLSRLDSKDAGEIEAVQQVLLHAPGEDVLDAVARALPETSVKGKIVLLELLGARKAYEYKERVFAETKSPQVKVRAAAASAFGEFANEADLPRLIDLLLQSERKAVREAVQKAIGTAASRIPDEQERAEPLIEAYAQADVEDKQALLGAMGRVRGGRALETVVEATKSQNSEIRDAAIRVLSEWESTDAAPELLQIASNSDELKYHVLAMRGYIRLSGQKEVPDEKKLQMLREGMEAARRSDEKASVMAAAADINTTASLVFVMPYLDDLELREEAAVSVINIAAPSNRRKRLRDLQSAKVLAQAASIVEDESLKKRAEKHANQIHLRIEKEQPEPDADGFVPLFNGENLAGWTGPLDDFDVEDGVLVCRKEAKGNLFTERQFSNFVLRFEFKLTPGANNGLGIRAPLEGDPAFAGMEIQILDNTSEKFRDLKPWQTHGSIYGIAAAETGHLNEPGEWNTQEVTADGRDIRVKLNGEIILEANLDDAVATGTLSGRPHPGLERKFGHIGFLGHGSRVEFRNIAIKELLNEPPEGFVALFNGEDLSAWKGLVENPVKRARMSPEELATAQEKADEEMREHWHVVNGTLIFDGEGSNLSTEKDFADFEVLLDWKIGPGGDSGVYLRGTPQVQIWDAIKRGIGSGGLFNNEKHTSLPLQLADNPVGDWNTFRIKMVDDRVTVHLNEQLVVDDVVLENYWDRSRPIFPSGPIELQSHFSPVFFQNIFIRELGESEASEAER